MGTGRDSRRTEALPMRDPKLVAMTGPLSEYRDGFADKLAGVGYATASAEHQVGLMAHLSRWMEGRGLGRLISRRNGLGSFSRRGVLAATPCCCHSGRWRRCWATCVTWARCRTRRRLRSPRRRCWPGTTALPAERAGPVRRERQRLPGRGQAVPGPAGPVGRAGPGKAHSRAGRGFAVVQCGQRPVASAKVLVVGLRSLLRFLFLAGHTRQQLAWAVPTPAGFTGDACPGAGARGGGGAAGRL